MNRNGALALAFHTVFIAFILAPIVMVCAVALTPEGYLALPTRGISFRWFRAIADNPQFLAAFWTTLWLGAVSATIALALAVPAALAIARYRFPGRDTIQAFLLAPLMIPHIVLGVAMLRFVTQIGLNGTFAALVAGHVIIVLPFALRLVLTASIGLDRRIEHAAESLGAGSWTVFRRVTLPLILPGVASGWVLAFITSFDELTMSIFVASPSTITLPVRIFLHIEDTIDPLVTAVSASLVYLALAAMLVLERVYGLERLLVGRGRE